MFRFTDCNTVLYGLNLDGQTDGSPIAVRADGSGTFESYDSKISNLGVAGTQGVDPSSTTGVYGYQCINLSRVVITNYVGSNLIDVPDGTYGDNDGTVRHIFIYNCESYHIEAPYISNGGQGDDNDFIQLLDDRATPTMTGTIIRPVLLYNHRVRRVIKYQGGNHNLVTPDIRPGSDFVSVATAMTVSNAAIQGSTQSPAAHHVGAHGLQCLGAHLGLGCGVDDAVFVVHVLLVQACKVLQQCCLLWREMDACRCCNARKAKPRAAFR
jgi:hypothetical protein